MVTRFVARARIINSDMNSNMNSTTQSTESARADGGEGKAGSPALERLAWAGAIVGGVSLAAALAADPHRAWSALLVHNFYFLSIALMGVVFIAMHTMVRAGWLAVLRRVAESMGGYLIPGAVLMIASLAGARSIYIWTDPDIVAADPLLMHKSAYLNLPWFAVRMIVILGVWIGFARALASAHRARDAAQSQGDQSGAGASGASGRVVSVSAAFLIACVSTYCLAAADWMLSLEPHWVSTLFPWYAMSSGFVAALAVLTLLAIALRRRGDLPELRPDHLHDLGKYLFAFSIFWAYLFYSQFMLIWYANIPEEAAYYELRGGPWFTLYAINLAINFALPFALLPRAMKRREGLMVFVSLAIVAGHWLDFYLMAMPSGFATPPLGWIEIGTGVGIASIFYLAWLRALRREAVIPAGDPYLAESLSHHVS